VKLTKTHPFHASILYP